MMKAQLVVTKLLVDDKITACVKQIRYVSWVLYVKFPIEKHFLVKHFPFLRNVYCQYLNFVL